MSLRSRLFNLGRRVLSSLSVNYFIRFIGVTDNNYGYVAFTTPLVLGDYDITATINSYVAGFILLGSSDNSDYIKLNNAAVEFKSNFSITSIPISAKAEGFVRITRVGTTATIYLNDVQIGTGTVNGTVATYDYFGKNAAAAVSTWFKAADIVDVNFNNDVIYLIQEEGNLIDSSGNNNTGILSTLGDGLPQIIQI